MNNANRIITTLRLKTLGPLVTGLSLLAYSGWQRHLDQVVLAAEGDLILSEGMWGKPGGAINQRGQTVIPFCYKDLGSMNEFGLAIASDTHGKYGCINRLGEVVIPFEWDRVAPFDTAGRAWVSRASETALVDTSGRVIESYPFSFLPPFNALGIARTCKSQSIGWGLVYRAGDEVSTPQWDSIEPFDDNGYAVVTLLADNRQTRRYGVINETGQLQFEPIWLEISRLRERPTGVYVGDTKQKIFDSDGWCRVRGESGCGWIDRNGFVVSPQKWKSASSFTDFDDGSESLARVSDENGSGFINRHGDVVIPTKFRQASMFDADGLASAEVGDKDHEKHGWINTLGEFVIEPEWDDVGVFAPNGLARICRNGKWGCIDRDGRIRVEPKWYSVAVWNDWYNQPWRNDGIHVVSYSPDQWLILDHNGREIQDLGTPPKCWPYGFDPANCERSDFGFQRYYYDQSKAGRFLHKMAMSLPGTSRRLASKITEPLGRWSLEYEVLNNSGRTIWSTVQSERHRQRAILSAVAGGLFLVWSCARSQFGTRVAQSIADLLLQTVAQVARVCAFFK